MNFSQRVRFLIFILAMGMVAGGRAGTSTAAPVLRKGAVIFQAGFDTDRSLAEWTGPVAAGPGYTGRGLVVQRPNGAPSGAAMITCPLPVEKLRGSKITATARVRATGVSQPPQPWNGVKFMLVIETPSRKLYPQAALETGSFDWRLAGLTTSIPAEATKAYLVLGLEQVSGQATFDDVQVVMVRPPRSSTTRMAGTRSPASRVRSDVPRLRGAMVGPRCTAEDLRVLGVDWNANLIRWQLIRRGQRPGESVSVENYDAWLEGELDQLDRLLPACREYGLWVILDLHSPPGGRATSSGYVGSDDRLFSDPACQEKFVSVWRRLARHYRDEPVIRAFDLANEPVETFVAPGCDDWADLATRAARAIREIDPDRWLVVEAPPWGGPDSLADFVPLPLDRVIYSAHMYVPHAFTHQGVHANRQESFVYPGEIEGRHWDKAALAQALRPVANFQRRYGVPIYIGEFSAIRWAPEGSAYRYLRDVIEIFEEQGWDWSYHAFREWSGWSVEHGPDRDNAQRAVAPTARERLLRSWFAKNRKPAWAGSQAER